MVGYDPEKCMLCGGCVAVCPRLDVLILYDAFLEYHEENCINCNACVKICPVGAMTPEK